MLFHVRLACCWEVGIAKRGIHACCVVNVLHNFGVQGGAIGQYILLHREGRERREIRICGGLREWGEDDQYEDSKVWRVYFSSRNAGDKGHEGEERRFF